MVLHQFLTGISSLLLRWKRGPGCARKFVKFYISYIKFVSCPAVSATVMERYSNLLYCIALNCIVLYLYIYIALFEVHTNQKRFQCKRPRKKSAVLRERKEALGSPINKVDRAEGRSWFQSAGKMIAKARVWGI